MPTQEPPRPEPGSRTPHPDFALYATLFSLVFVAGFAVIAFVLASRRRGAPPRR